VARGLPISLEFLIAVVGLPDTVALGLALRCRDRNYGQVVVLVFCQVNLRRRSRNGGATAGKNAPDLASK
jgi:hypothetical protein